MTTYYYGLNSGGRQEEVVVSTSTTSKDVEIVVNGTNVPTQIQALTAVENIENFIAQYKYPPA